MRGGVNSPQAEFSREMDMRRRSISGLVLLLLAASSGFPAAIPAAEGPPPDGNAPQSKQRELAQTVVCVDVANSWPLRSRITGDHLKYIDSIKDHIRIGGPIRGSEGKPVGSIIVYATASLEEAKRLLADDPFSRGALFASCTWYPFVQYVGTYVGGWAEPR
jgi:uncharacterized protein